MKTIQLSTRKQSIEEILHLAREDSLLVTTDDGETFVISKADELDTEVELLRRNHRFITMLDRFKSERDTIPIAQVERQLR